MKKSAALVLGLLLAVTGCSGGAKPGRSSTTSSRPTSTAASTPGRDVIVQLFEWNWRSVAAECPRLAAQGYAAVQVSPASEHVEVGAHPWWQDYQPVSYQLVTRRGDRTAYAAMIGACHKAGIKVYADAVVNHMAGVDTGVGSAGTKFTHYDYPGTWTSADFHHDCGSYDGNIHDYGDRSQVQNCQLSNLADLATEKPQVRAGLAKYLNDLISLGIDGFRLDAAKHIPAADLTAVLSELGKKVFVYQEVIDHGNEPITATEYVRNGKVLVFTYGEEVGKEFQWGTIAALKDLSGPVSSSQAVVFLDNHDTQRNGGSGIVTYRNPSAYKLANVFLLSYPYGQPRVMSSYDFGTDTDAGPPAGADGTTTDTACGTTWVCEHRWPTTVAMVGFHNTVGTAPLTLWWDNGQNALAYARGDRGYVVINNEGTTLTRSFQTKLAAGRYCDRWTGGKQHGTCQGTSVQVNGEGWFTASIPARAALVIDVDTKA